MVAQLTQSQIQSGSNDTQKKHKPTPAGWVEAVLSTVDKADKAGAIAGYAVKGFFAGCAIGVKLLGVSLNDAGQMVSEIVDFGHYKPAILQACGHIAPHVLLVDVHDGDATILFFGFGLNDDQRIELLPDVDHAHLISHTRAVLSGHDGTARFGTVATTEAGSE